MAKNLSMGLRLGKTFAAAALAVLGCASCAARVDFGQPGHEKRGLTPGETKLANSFFAAQLDTSKITIASVKGETSMALNNHIDMSKDNYSDNFAKEEDLFKKSVFMHELTHIWQEQNGVDLSGEAIASFFKFGGDYNKSYSYNLDKDKFFNKLTIEQQAKMVADYYKEREQLAPYNVDIFCPDLKKREAILKQTFTHLETPSLCK